MNLDGTLTQHKTHMNDANKKALRALSEKYKLLMVGAGQVLRIFNQLEKFPIDIIGNYGLQYGEYNRKSGEIDIIRDDFFAYNKEDVENKVTYFRKKYGFTDFYGDNMEYHPSGCITFPI